MTVYNVKASVVGLVEAADEDDAVIQLQDSLRRHGFDPYQGDGDALESERGVPAAPLP
jgi:hypothetical protein